MARRRINRRRETTKPEIQRGGGRIVAVFLLSVIVLVAGLAGLHRWKVPEVDERGLRVSGDGRADASHVLDPGQFRVASVRDAYTIAHRIPETLNQLYCWCGCIDRGLHRSALECFESRHGADCTICVGTAVVAWSMTQRGVTDPAEIQREIDRRYDPFG